LLCLIYKPNETSIKRKVEFLILLIE
jgi:hypothetical protein